MDWKRRNKLSNQIAEFDRIADKISALRNAKSDLGAGGGWKFDIKSRRTADAGCICSSELSDENEQKIRAIISEDIDHKIAGLEYELTKI